jgi:hypothetical protein
VCRDFELCRAFVLGLGIRSDRFDCTLVILTSIVMHRIRRGHDGFNSRAHATENFQTQYAAIHCLTTCPRVLTYLFSRDVGFRITEEHLSYVLLNDVGPKKARGRLHDWQHLHGCRECMFAPCSVEPFRADYEEVRKKFSHG